MTRTGMNWTNGPCPSGTTRPSWASSCTGVSSQCLHSANGFGTTGPVSKIRLIITDDLGIRFIFFLTFIPAGNKEYVQFMKANYPPNFTYAEFASQFRAEFFNPDQWADIFQSSGAKFVNTSP